MESGGQNGASHSNSGSFKQDLQKTIETHDVSKVKSLLEIQDVKDFIRQPKFFWHDVQCEIPVHNANFSPEILALFLNSGADPNAVCEYDGHGPLKVSHTIKVLKHTDDSYFGSRTLSRRSWVTQSAVTKWKLSKFC